MSNGSKRGQRWLDSIARWSAGARGDAGSPAALDGEGPSAPGGMSRRTALRMAAGAGALAVIAPTRLLQPSGASAIDTNSPLEKCILDNYTTVYGDLKACTSQPLEEYDDISESIAIEEIHLREQKKPSARRRIKKNLARSRRERARAEKAVDFCNALFLEERANGEAKCQETCNTASTRAARRRAGEQCKSPPGEPGGGGGGGSGGCEPGSVLCGDYCCSLEYATCAGCNGTPICCRIGGNCCPGG